MSSEPDAADIRTEIIGPYAIAGSVAYLPTSSAGNRA
jgi:hypothetical protein